MASSKWEHVGYNNYKFRGNKNENPQKQGEILTSGNAAPALSPLAHVQLSTTIGAFKQLAVKIWIYNKSCSPVLVFSVWAKW